MPGGRRWTADDDHRLVALLGEGAAFEQIAATLNRTTCAVWERRHFLGRCGHRAPAWTVEDEDAIARGLECHKPYREIARALGRTEIAVRDRAARLGVNTRNTNGRTVRATAVLLGVDWHAVGWWIRQGWLRAHRTGLLSGKGQQRVVEYEDLLAFLEDSSHWHLWEPERIGDAGLRLWTAEMRAGVRYLTTGEAGDRLGLTHYTVNGLIRQGRIRAVKRGANWLIRQEDCVYPAWLPRPKGPPLTDEQRAFVRCWHGLRPGTWIAERLGCSDEAVYLAVRQLGLQGLGRGYWKRKRRSDLAGRDAVG